MGIKISQLPAAGSATSTDLVPVVQSGTTKTVTVSQILANSTPGGSNTQLQYNNSNAFGGISTATFSGGVLSLALPVTATMGVTASISGSLTRTAAGLSYLVAGSNITITSGTATDQVTIASTGGGTPGGSNTQLQYNNAGSFGGISTATFSGGALNLSLPVTASLGVSASFVRLDDAQYVFGGGGAYPLAGMNNTSAYYGTTNLFAGGTQAAITNMYASTAVGIGLGGTTYFYCTIGDLACEAWQQLFAKAGVSVDPGPKALTTVGGDVFAWFSGSVGVASGANRKITVLGGDAVVSGSMQMQNVTAPSVTPVGGGFLYAEAGAGKWKGSSGTVTTFGTAEPHCPTCGRDFAHEWVNEVTNEALTVCVPCMHREMERVGINVSAFTFVRRLKDV